MSYKSENEKLSEMLSESIKQSQYLLDSVEEYQGYFLLACVYLDSLIPQADSWCDIIKLDYEGYKQSLLN